jgi:hypothetical protein
VELELVEWSEFLSDLVLSLSVGSQLVQLRIFNEIGNGQRGCEAMNTEVGGSTALEAVMRQLLKIQ